MIIQNIVFPSKDFNPTEEAYFRIKDCTLASCEGQECPDAIIMKEGSHFETNTYFNGYSVFKWKKYTEIRDVFLHLELAGAFSVEVFQEYRARNENHKILLKVQEFDSDKSKTYGVDIPIPDEIEKGIVSFKVNCLKDDSVFKGGYYYTTQDESCFNDVFFAVDICTYKREEYLTRNIELVNSKIFKSNLPIRDKFEFFISDNGKSVCLEDDYDGMVHVFPNKNTGGAGGFGRCMIEILRSKNYDRFTHIIMMDDDIVLSAETLYRTYVLAKTLKSAYNEAFIGGAMLDRNNPKIQSENMDIWKVTKSAPIKYRYDITMLDYVLKNEIEDKGDHFGWWYCVMPIGVVKANNLPLPIFIKRDDIEYGIRNGCSFITLNGLCVLHESFSLKRKGYLEYYYWRNLNILNAIHFPSYKKRTLKKQMLTQLKYAMQTYRYDDANLAFVGVEDFLKGVSWLKETDAEALNRYVMDYTYKAIPIQDISFPFAHGSFERYLADKKKIEKAVYSSRSLKVIRKIVFGWLLKAKTNVRYVEANAPSLPAIYRVKTVINYDEDANKAFITKKSYRQAFNLIKNYIKLCAIINKDFDKAQKEYRIRFKELTSLASWERYLGLSEPLPVNRDFESETRIKNGPALDKELRKRKTLRKDKKFYAKVVAFRTVQRFLFWIPIRKKRVSFYINERRGYTCNLKYISEELIKRYWPDIEIVWITRYPESCEELESRGISVVRLNSIRHWFYQFTSKAVIVNDSFPETVLLRNGQITMNTWHASMNYKHIGEKYVHFRNNVAKKLFRIRNKQPKIYLSGSQFFSNDTSKSFGFDPDVFVPTGSPRNDIFFQNCVDLNKRIRDRYAISPEQRIVLYAPTFRLGYHEDTYGLDFDALIQALNTRFGGRWVVFYRKHYFVHSKGTISNKAVIDVSDYDDMNELLAVSDVLISDYSSCLWDFALTKRPSFIYATDIKEYCHDDRDFSYPIEKWPYSISTSNEELENNIISFNQEEYEDCIRAHLDDGVSFDDGHASERVVDLLSEKMKLG